MQNDVTGLLAGKKGLITGVANNMSIAWAIANAAKEQGANISLTNAMSPVKNLWISYLHQ